jgi:preprotein translocase YajC subunit
MALLAITAYFLLILPMRRERRQRLQMVSALKKGDRVVVSNAIVGTVAQEPKAGDAGDAEVLVRIDEGNVKMRVLVSAITRVLPDKKDSKDGA